MSYTKAQLILLAATVLLFTGCVGGNDRTGYDADVSTTISIDDDIVLPEELREPDIDVAEVLGETGGEGSEEITEDVVVTKEEAEALLEEEIVE